MFKCIFGHTQYAKCIQVVADLYCICVLTDTFKDQLQAAQHDDSILKQIISALQTSSEKPSGRKWCRLPLILHQLWTQLNLIDSVLCCVYAPGPSSDVSTVPVMPDSLQQQALQHSHNDRSACHQGADKTLVRLRKECYWVHMCQDVERYRHECTGC